MANIKSLNYVAKLQICCLTFLCIFHDVDMSFSHYKLESRLCLWECDGQTAICILNLQLK